MYSYKINEINRNDTKNGIYRLGNQPKVTLEYSNQRAGIWKIVADDFFSQEKWNKKPD